MFLIWNSENSYLLAVVRIKCDKPSAGVGEYSQAVGKLLHQGGHAGEGEDGQHSKWKLGRVRKKGLKGPASEHSEEGRSRPGLQSPLLHIKLTITFRSVRSCGHCLSLGPRCSPFCLSLPRTELPWLLPDSHPFLAKGTCINYLLSI